MRLFTLIAFMAIAPVAQGQGYLNQIHPDTGELIPFARSEYPGLIEDTEPSTNRWTELQLITHIPDGSTKRVHFLDDDTYIFHSGTAIIVAALDDKGEIVELSRTTVDFLVADITVQGDIAYVASATEGGLTLIDISDHSNISKLGEDAGYNALAVAVGGNYVYVGRATAGVRVYDVSDPASPAVITDIPPTGGSANGLHVQDDVLYVANGNPASAPRVLFFDVSNPEEPIEIGGISDLEGFVTYMFRDDDILYVNGAVGLATVDVSNLEDPVILDTYSTGGGNTFRSGVVDGRLVLAGVDGMFVLDVSDPENIELIAEHPEGQGLGVAISPDGSQALYADRLRAVHLFDLGEDDIIEVAAYRNGGFTGIPYWYDDILYVVDLAGGLIILSFESTFSEPDWIGRYESHPNSQYLEINGDIGFLTNADFTNSGLEVIDLSDPLNPKQIAFLPTDSQLFGLDIVGDIVFVAAGFGGIMSVDVSDPENPEILDMLPFGSNIFDLIVINDVAYLSSFGGGGISVDVSDPANLVLLFAESEWGFLQGVAQVPHENSNFSYELILYSDGQHGLRIVDIEDPEDLVSLGTVSGSGQARDVAVDWNGGIPFSVNYHIAYTAADFYGLNVYTGEIGLHYYRYEEGFRSSDRGIGVDIWKDYTRGFVTILAMTSGEGGVYIFSAKYPVGSTEGDLSANSITLNTPYPNPSIGTVTFSYDLRATGDVTLSLFDVLGRQITIVTDDIQAAGTHTMEFDTSGLATGTYLIRLIANGQTATQTFTVLK